jgi:hypothetical protein
MMNAPSLALERALNKDFMQVPRKAYLERLGLTRSGFE